MAIRFSLTPGNHVYVLICSKTKLNNFQSMTLNFQTLLVTALCFNKIII